jgi:hypothetical protein
MALTRENILQYKIRENLLPQNVPVLQYATAGDSIAQIINWCPHQWKD